MLQGNSYRQYKGCNFVFWWSVKLLLLLFFMFYCKELLNLARQIFIWTYKFYPLKIVNFFINYPDEEMEHQILGAATIEEMSAIQSDFDMMEKSHGVHPTQIEIPDP